jgi:hypothetical protein
VHLDYKAAERKLSRNATQGSRNPSAGPIVSNHREIFVIFVLYKEPPQAGGLS